MTILTRRATRTACAAFVLAACLLPSPSAAADSTDGHWTRQAPTPTWLNLRGVSTISSTESWLASAPLLGDVGEILHTTDAGRTWAVVDVPREMNTVFFVDPLHGWAAGNAFFHTTDGGKTWAMDNDWGTIEDLYFLDTKHGWAAGNGGVTYYTSDGGLHWDYAKTPARSTIGTIWFSDLSNGWAVDIDGRIIHTGNGGRTWTLKATVEGNNLQMIQFFDLKEGWAIGGDDFYHTTDGGKTWNRTAVPGGTWAYSARFFDRMNAVAVGEYGNIVRTRNGGATWQTIAPVGSGQRLWDVEYGDADTLVLVGDNGTVERSTDGGVTWRSLQSGGTGVTHGFDRISARTLWAGQDGGEIVYTVNGGSQWTRATVQGFDVFGHIRAVAFADESRGWAAGGNEAFGGDFGVISRSDDGGRTWQQKYQLADFTFNGLETINRQTAIAVASSDFVGGGGLVLRTTDGGSTWQDVAPSGEGFNDVFFVNESTGWLVGSRIYRSTDGGRHWTRQYGDGTAKLDSVSFSDTLNGWATGYDSLVLHTADGGKTWVPQDLGVGPGLPVTGVSAVDASTAWVAGYGGFLALTTDHGKTWARESIPGAGRANFEDAMFLSANRGWVGGEIGIWSRRL